MSIKTDSKAVEEPKDPEHCNLFQIYKLFASDTEIQDLDARYRNGGIGYGEVKKMLFEKMWVFFAPYRQEREKLVKNLDFVHQVMDLGAKRAREIAIKTMQEVKQKVGLSY